jgi:hypothetical protein
LNHDQIRTWPAHSFDVFICQVRDKIELNLLYRWGENEQKLKTSYHFQSKRGITLPKTIEPWPNSNLTCIYSWYIHMSSLSWICCTVGEIMNGNRKFHNYYFQSKRGITLPKIIEPWPNSNLTCIFSCQIWVECVQPLLR